MSTRACILGAMLMTSVGAACGAHGPDVSAVSASDSAAAPFARGAPLPSTCTAPLALAPPNPERWIDDAARRPPLDMGVWWTRPMQGPFDSRDEAAAGCRDVETLPRAAPFDAIVHCATGNPKRPPGPDNQPRHLLLLRTARGWWTQELARDRWPHGGPDEELRVGAVHDLAALDRFGDGGVELTAIAEEGPPGGAKIRRLIVCGVGGSSTPACADIRISAGGPFHGKGTMAYRLELGCDGTLSVAGWEGGVQPKLVHGRGRLAFP